jgi:hypothetical protein
MRIRARSSGGSNGMPAVVANARRAARGRALAGAGWPVVLVVLRERPLVVVAMRRRFPSVR